jgi:hypothetical protein
MDVLTGPPLVAEYDGHALSILLICIASISFAADRLIRAKWHLLKAIVRIFRHSHAGGNPGGSQKKPLDSRLRGNDVMGHKQ